MAFCYGIIGDNGSGKSTRCRQIAQLFKKAHPKAGIYAHDINGDFEDLANDFIHAHTKDLWVKLSKLSNCLLILDELRVLHPNAQAHRDLLQLMAVRRKRNINIVYVVHNPALVLNAITYYTYKYFVYYTNSREGSFSDKIPSSELAITGSRLINNYVGAFSQSQYKAMYPKFPHVIVDTKAGNLQFVNVKERIFNQVNK